MLKLYLDASWAAAWHIATWAAIGVLLAALDRRLARRPRAYAWARRGLLAISIVWGLLAVRSHAAVFDDAFISLRYARNLLEGHGLVFNPGERVEGYTNFLWTLLVAAGTWSTGLELPQVALALCVAAYLACLLLTYRLSTHLSGRLPIAVLLLATQGYFVRFGTTGMETEAAVALTLGGLLWLIREPTPARALAAGACFVAAAWMRPDHGIFYAVGGLALLLEVRLRWRVLGAYALALAPYALYWIARSDYYGLAFPNTFYAKAAGESYFSQGLVYLESFYASTHLWILAPVALVWLFASGPAPAARRFRRFTLAAMLAYHLYVARIGGDFMLGRFLVVALPLWLLAAESVWSAAQERSRGWAWGVALLLCATQQGVDLLPPGKFLFRLSDETTFYRIATVDPVRIRNASYFEGRAFRPLARAGTELRIASTAVGLLGYYGNLYTLDRYGLLDPEVARLPLYRRGRPGHEKWASDEYLRRRGVMIARKGRPPKRFAKSVEVSVARSRDWHLLYYDAKLIEQIRAHAPAIHLPPFVEMLDAYETALTEHVAGREWTPHPLVPMRLRPRSDLAWFESFYFAHTDDPQRRDRLRRLVAEATARAKKPIGAGNVEGARGGLRRMARPIQ